MVQPPNRATTLRRSSLSCCLASLLLAAAAAAQSPPPEVDRSAWETGWHVVRPGDTLEGLAHRFLGSEDHWRELARINPDVANPHFILPGQRVRIFLDRPTPQPSAQIVALSRRVEERPQPVPWRTAGEGDVLLERDSLRTYANSSAGLRFDDGAALTLNADSLVFIRRQAPPTAAGQGRKEIEIELGQADVASAPAAPLGGEIEVVVGGARGSGRAEPGKPLRTRARKTGDATAQFMVYEGTGTVSAAGSKVELAAGSGTTVPPQAAPGPAEPLLPAPTGLSPGPGQELEVDDPALSWNAVPGAAHYLVESCRDAACGAVLERQSGLTATSTRLASPDLGALYWRVTAVAASGLDGFPSPIQPLQAVAALPLPPPVVRLAAPGSSSPSATSCFAAPPELAVTALDAKGNALRWTPLLDGRELAPEAWTAMWPGEHEVSARAVDPRGRSVSSPPVAFAFDPSAPWLDLTAAGASPPEATEKKSRAKAREAPVPACDSGLEVRDPATGWIPVPCATNAVPVAARVAVTSEQPAVELRTTGRALELGGMRVSAGEALRLAAWDVGCGPAEIALAISPSPYTAGAMQLGAEVADRAGNRRSLGWRLTGR